MEVFRGFEFRYSEKTIHIPQKFIDRACIRLQLARIIQQRLTESPQLVRDRYIHNHLLEPPFHG